MEKRSNQTRVPEQVLVPVQAEAPEGHGRLGGTERKKYHDEQRDIEKYIESYRVGAQGRNMKLAIPPHT
jgi:hypothetical protein